mmetsp:Transcript_18334/g.44154  ORF Transcript_18334/g.44154 Transcript_18334/m.44154 type:complete len:81 (-) Transcript_18334:958-1200(-)
MACASFWRAGPPGLLGPGNDGRQAVAASKKHSAVGDYCTEASEGGGLFLLIMNANIVAQAKSCAFANGTRRCKGMKRKFT